MNVAETRPDEVEGEQSGGRPVARWRRVLRSQFFLQPVLFVGLITLWDGVVNVFHIQNYLLPPPLDVGKRIIEDLTTARFWYQVWVTMEEVLLGFGIAVISGILLGVLVVASATIERLLTPYIVAFQTLPKVALAPLIIIWMGYGLVPKVVLAAVIAFFPVFVNMVAGLKANDPDQVFLMRSLRATKFQTLVKLRMFAVLPYLLAGIDVAVIFALIGAIVVEFVGSAYGIGAVIIQRQAYLDVAGTLSTLTILSAFGIVLHVIFHVGGRKLASWADQREVVAA